MLSMLCGLKIVSILWLLVVGAAATCRYVSTACVFRGKKKGDVSVSFEFASIHSFKGTYLLYEATTWLESFPFF